MGDIFNSIQINILIMSILPFRKLYNLSHAIYPTFQTTGHYLKSRFSDCYTIKDAVVFVEQNKQMIQQYGTFYLLDYLTDHIIGNMTPNMTSKQMSLFDFALKFQVSNMYEESLKYAILEKLSYSRQKQVSQKYQHLQEQQYNKLIKMINKFDFMDAVNWIHLQRYSYQPLLKQYAFKMIDKEKNKRYFQYRLTQSLPIFLRKLVETNLPEMQIRNIYRFLCYSFEASLENASQKLNILDSLTNMKLHLIGYNRVPKAVDQIYLWMSKNINSLNYLILQGVFKCFDNLPYDYRPQTYELFYNKILKLAKDSITSLHFDKIPFKRMSAEQRQTFLRAINWKTQAVQILIYCGNSQVINYLKSDFVIDTLYRIFYLEKNKHGYETELASQIPIYYISAKLILQRYPQSQQKLNTIKLKINSQINKAKFFNNSSNSIFDYLSLSNLLYFYYFQQKLDKDYQFNARLIFRKKLQSYHKKSDIIYRRRKFMVQFINTIICHIDTKNVYLIQCLNDFIAKQLKNKYVQDRKYIYFIIFKMQNSVNQSHYSKHIQTFYQMIQTEYQAIIFLEGYFVSDQKNYNLNEFIISWVWKKFNKFYLVAKIMAFGGRQNFIKQNQLSKVLTPILHTINSSQIMQFITNVGLGELYYFIKFSSTLIKDKNYRFFLHKFCKCFIQNFTNLKFVVNSEQQINLFFLIINQLFSLLLNLSMLNIQVFAQFEHKIKQMSRNTTNLSYLIIKECEWKCNFDRNYKYKFMMEKINLQEFINWDKNISNDPYIKYEGMLIILKLYSAFDFKLPQSICNKYITELKTGLSNGELEGRRVIQIIGPFYNHRWAKSINLQGYIYIESLIDFIINHLNQKYDGETYLFFLKIARLGADNKLFKNIIKHIVNLNHRLSENEQLSMLKLCRFFNSFYVQEYFDCLINNMKQKVAIDYDLRVIEYIQYCYYQVPQNYSAHFNLTKIQTELLKNINMIKNIKEIDENFVITLIKFCWILIKKNKLSDASKDIFVYLIHKISFVSALSKKSMIEGYNNQIIVLIYLSIIHFLIKSSANLSQLPYLQQFDFNKRQSKFIKDRSILQKRDKEKQQQRPNSLKSSESVSIIQNSLHQISSVTKNKAFRSVGIQKYFDSLGLCCVNKPTEGIKNVYVPLYKCQGIQFSYYVISQKNQYLIMIKDKLMRNQYNCKTGKLKFYQEAVRRITGKQLLIFTQNDFTIPL